MTMGDRVALLKDGELQQVDTPRHMYEKPANVFVAGFIGSPAMNITQFPLRDGQADLGHGSSFAIPRVAADQVSGEGTITVGYRPESLEIVGQGTPGSFPVVVNVVEELGAEGFAYCSFIDTNGQPTGLTDVIVRVDPKTVPMKGERIYLRINEGEAHLFSTGSGLRLNI